MDVENRTAREVRLVGHTSGVPLIFRRGSVSIAALALLSLAVDVLLAQDSGVSSFMLSGFCVVWT